MPASAAELFARNKNAVLATCRRNRLFRLTAYGSRVRDDSTQESDLDLVAILPHGTGLLDVVRIQDELSRAFGCRVDLGSERPPGSRLAMHAAEEGIVLYDALKHPC